MRFRFIYTVERLTAFHSALIDSLRAMLLNALPQVGAMLQALLLDVLQRGAANMSDLMTDMKPVLPSLLASHNHALQNNALRLLKVLLPAENDDSAGGFTAAETQDLTQKQSACFVEQATKAYLYMDAFSVGIMLRALVIIAI